MWSWAFVSVDNPTRENIVRGTNLDSFIAEIETHNSSVYFHNLKFDGRFLFDWLFKNGYEYSEDDGAAPGTFHALISEMGRFYSITVRWFNGHNTEFRDSLNKIPLPVSRISKAFGMEETKGEIDYDAPRPVGYEPTAEEWDYLFRDVLIVAIALKQVLDSGMTRLTVASDSLAEFKRLTGTKLFARRFPVMSEHMDSEIRRAYRGGFTYADDRFRGKRVGSGIVLDVNSLYPAVMSTSLLPWGEPQFQDGRVTTNDEWPLAIFSVTFTAKLKRNKIPCIQIKSSNIFGSVEYQRKIDTPVTLMMTNVDFALYQEHYDMTILEWGGGWRFKGACGMFDDYIDKWSKIKQEATGGQREIAKLHLNSLYGKFATNPEVKGMVPYLDGDTVKLKPGLIAKRPPVYTAVGVFITSYARDLTLRAAQANYKVFAYADTDSLHLLTDNIPEDIDVHPSRMGAWKFEYAFKEAYYVRPKFYLERLGLDAVCPSDCTETHDHTFDYVVRVAGLPERVSRLLTFEDLTEGRELSGKLTPRAVPGGVVLNPVGFTIKDVARV